MPYLDVQVDLESGKLQTDVYSKLTDTNQYLDCNSFHPAYVKKTIPYGQALRLKRIGSSDNVLQNVGSMKWRAFL